MKLDRISGSKLRVILCFAIIFIYGTLLLMIGYTQGGLSTLLFPHKSTYIVYLLMAQSFGLIISTLLLTKLLKLLNIRYIFSSGMLIACIMLIFISELDKFSSNKTVLIVLFAIFSLIMGIGIGSTSPLISTYLSAVYSGQKRTTMLSVSNGVYGIGAGIIPLVASAAIINISTKGFDNIRYFYFIAASLALFAAVAGYFIDYKHTEQSTSLKILDKKARSFSIIKPLIMSIVLMSAYMIAETIANYMFVNVAKGVSNPAKSIQIMAIQGFGLFVMVQGVWRAFSGLFVTPYVKKRYFILVSAIIMLIGFIWIVAGGLRHRYGVYLIAVIFGFGIGNLWPAIFSYAIDTDERRASYIGMIINITSMAWIPLTQLVVATLWTQHASGVTNGALYYSPIILGIIASIAVIALLLFSLPLHVKLKKEYKDVVTRKD